MKNLKRLAALLIAALLVLAMAVPAMAEGNTITITNAKANTAHTYTAYQVFSGKIGEAGLGEIDWGTGVNGAALLTALKALESSPYSDATSAEDVAKILAGFQNDSDNLKTFAQVVGENLTTTGVVSTVKTPNTIYEITGLEDGYYLVKETGINYDAGDGLSTSKYMLKVAGDAALNVKDEEITPDKNILKDAETRVKENTAAVGDTVTFEVKIPVPVMDGYKEFKFVMNDKLPKGLTYTGLTSIDVGNTSVDVTDLTDGKGDGTNVVVTVTDNATTQGTDLRIAFKDFMNKYKGETGKNVVIVYTAVVNSDADFTPSGNINEVVFEFSNNPSKDSDGTPDFAPNEPHGITPESKTTTYLTKLKILKVDDKNQPLAGATFEMSGSALNKVVVTTKEEFKQDASGTYYKLDDGTYTEEAPTEETKDHYPEYDGANTPKYKKEESTVTQTVEQSGSKVSATSGKDGVILFEGLNEGTYTITETEAPAGYNKMTESVQVKIKWDATKKKLVLDGEAVGSISVDNDGLITVTIINRQGNELPSTGGFGTTLFYMLGVALMVVTAVLMVTKRRVMD